MAIGDFVKRATRILKHHGLRGLLARCLPDVDREKRRMAEDQYIASQLPLARELYQERLQEFTSFPKISIVVPVCDPPLKFLKEMIRSVTGQVYPNWELCIADDASKRKEVVDLLRSAEKQDERIKVVFREERGHIARASQSALELATGDFVALLDHDDVLPFHALFHIVQEVQGEDASDIFYTNEIKIDEDGVLFAPALKPRWSPFYFRSFMFVGHLTVYRKSLLDEVQGFREDYAGSQDFDLFLRASERTKKIQHIPRALYYWRSHSGSVAGAVGQKGYAFESAKKALQDSVRRVSGVNGVTVSDGPYPGTYQYNGAELQVAVVGWSDLNAAKCNELIDGVEEEFVCLLRQGVELLEEDLRKLSAPLSFPFVGAAAPVFMNSDERVLAAGFTVTPDGARPNLYGDRMFTGGPGHRLYIGAEVDLVSLDAVCLPLKIAREFLKECGSWGDPSEGAVALADFLERRSLSRIVVPSVRLVSEECGISTEGLPQEMSSYYPIGYSRGECRYELFA